MNNEDYLELILSQIMAPQERLPLPEEVSYYALEKERKIYLDYMVSHDCIAIEQMILRWNMEDKGKPAEDRKPIRLYIHSGGGYLEYMWSLIDMIQASVTPVYTINVGSCASAAALIFMAGHKRYMMPRATVLIHEGSASFEGDSTKVLDASDSYRKDIKKMKDYIGERTQIPAKLLNKKRNNDWQLTADECLEYGVCNAIVRSLDEVI